MNRRNFLKALLPFALPFLPRLSLAEVRRASRVIVVGGGFSGSTCAKYLKLWGGSSVDVLLVDRREFYPSPILSNLVVVGRLKLSDITFGRSGLKRLGVRFRSDEVVDVDFKKKLVFFKSGGRARYDKLVLACGIDFKFPNSYDVNRVPHAWIAGPQTLVLRRLVDGLRDGDTFLMTVPPKPYRCPPGPYERACVVADYLRRKGVRARVVVLDANRDVVVEREIFKAKFREYGIHYIPSAEVLKVNDVEGILTAKVNGRLRNFKARALNVIPPQKAPRLLFELGLTRGDFAPVDPLTYESTVQKDVYIIGDSQGTSQPKAGHIGNSEAKVCADAVLRSLEGRLPFSHPKTNSACYSPVSLTEATWLTAVFKYDPQKRDMVLASNYFPRSSPPSKRNFKDMFRWAGNLFYDTFNQVVGF
ncbi:FAD-dependent oxidoreductase [Thermovibrio ammonificans]